MYHASTRGASREAEVLPTDKKRPRKQPPNQVWLDAIMSKARSAEPSPSASDAPPLLKQMRTMPGDDNSVDWAMAPTTNMRSSRTPSPAVASGGVPPNEPTEANPFAGQLAVADAALIAAVTKSLKDLVAEQDCSFIARGVCHLCSDKEKKVVPVVNFCPEFSPNHSLCREHLRSMHRVRLVDIFAGKNQPTVSKRALRCSVCSLSCPCSKCQLRRDAEIYKYKQWLGGGASGNGGVGFPDSSPDDDFEMGPRSRSRRNTPPPPDADVPYARADGKRRASDRPVYYEGEDKPVSEDAYPFDESGGGIPCLPASALRADEKGAARGENRFPKRAAKASVPYPLDSPHGGYPPPPPPVSASAEVAPDLPSPSAASVLNCPGSEKSLVDLLSSLNQRVTPAVRYFADANEPRFRDMMEGVPREHERDAYKRQSPADVQRPNEYDQDEYETSWRRQKRKRDSVSSSRASEDTMGYDMNDADPSNTYGVRSTVRVEDDDAPLYRQKAPTPLTTEEQDIKQAQVLGSGRPPSPSPKGRPSGKSKGPTGVAPPDPKMPSFRKRDPTPPSSATRKRKNDLLTSPPVAVAERRTPRGTAHRGHAHKTLPLNHASEQTKGNQHHRDTSADVVDDEEVVEEDDGDDSELDTNLDYCEVCLAAGDLVCCDVCPRSFHLKCLKMTEDDLPEGDWQCAECRKPSYFESFGAQVAAKSSVPGKCLQIVRCLKSHPFSKPFLNPVENVPHYTNIVKQPMDLTTIEKKLLEHKYTVQGRASGATGSARILHLASFAEDVRLVWSNCKLFNDDGSGITRAADQLSEGFEKLYRDVLDFVERSSSTNSMRRDEQRSSSAQDAKGRESTTNTTEIHGVAKVSETKSNATSSKHGGKPSNNQPQRDYSNRSSVNGSDGAKGSEAPSGSTTSATSANDKDSSTTSATGSGPTAAASVDQSKQFGSSSAATARSVSPSPVTTAMSTPSPTESAGFAHSQSVNLSSNASDSRAQKTTVPGPEAMPFHNGPNEGSTK